MSMAQMDETVKNELRLQEIKANKRIMRGFIWFFAIFAVIWLLTYFRFFVIDLEPVSMGFGITAATFVIPLHIYFKRDLSAGWVKYCLLALICVVVGANNAILSIHTYLLYAIPLLFAIQYREKKALWFTFAVNTVTMLLGSLASFYYGICDLNLLLSGNHTRDYYLAHYAEGALNISLNEGVNWIIIVFEVFPRTLMLFVFTVLLHYILVSNREDAIRIAELTYSKDTDIRTRLYNKNKYDEMADSYYPNVETVSVIFWDLNNLKKVNDRYGHASGDQLIEAMSAILYRFQSDQCKVYRIGGDEFLLITENPAEGETEHLITKIQSQMGKEKRGAFGEISCAVGMAAGKGKDIRNVVSQADFRMYEDKKRYKEEKK